jgi:ribosomal protein S18 acetylase RimI-like enzyme
VIRPLGPTDDASAARVLDETLGGRVQARMDELVDVLDRPALGAFVSGELAGVATYSIDDDSAELVALAVASPFRRRGLGAALTQAVIEAAAVSGAHRIWLVTTNDNVDALIVYQRQGFRLIAVHRGAVDRARRLKPSIPEVGSYGIALHDELVLERVVVRP